MSTSDVNTLVIEPISKTVSAIELAIVVLGKASVGDDAAAVRVDDPHHNADTVVFCTNPVRENFADLRVGRNLSECGCAGKGDARHEQSNAVGFHASSPLSTVGSVLRMSVIEW
jgi:hypothetical protein